MPFSCTAALPSGDSTFHRFTQLALCIGIALGWLDSGHAASVVEEISFEGGTIGDFGTPAATGWQFDQLNKIAKIDTVNSNRPAFEHGTNQEALLYNPWADPSFFVPHSGPRQGVLWEKQFDSSSAAAPVEQVDPGEIVYLYTEFFSDVARGNQTFKTNFYIGELGDGTSGQGGFSASAFDSTGGSTEAGWTWGNNLSDQGNLSSGIYESGGAGLFSGTRYPSPPTPADLERNHASILILRQGADAAAQFEGSEIELSESNGNFNGGDASNATDEQWGGNPAIITGKKFDKATIVFRRQETAVQSDPITASWIDPDVANCGSSPATCAYDAQIGVKYLRFGTADITDIDLDGVTDAADEGIVQANLGLFGPNTADFNRDKDVDGEDFLAWQRGVDLGTTRAEGDADGSGEVDGTDLALWQSEYGLKRATFFDGDVDNDLDVDTDDLAAVQAAFSSLSASSRVPEFCTFQLALLGALGMASARRLRR